MPRRTTRLKALASATLGVVIAAPSAAFATSIAVRSLQTSPHVVLDVTVRPGSVAVSRSDFFPRLVAMQRFAHARNFAVLKTNNSGLPSRRKLTCILDNFPTVKRDDALRVLDAAAQYLSTGASTR